MHAPANPRHPRRRLIRFLQMESAGGLVMLAATALALLAANSALAGYYQQFIHLPLHLGVGGFGITESLAEWVADGLMVLFFLLVGLELNRELREGVLADRRQVLLPLLAALGGMLAPAALFLIVNHGSPGHTPGWAIASATDIAFALCVLMLAARHAPPALKIFLLAIAIFDDIGAIIIIALFYSSSVSLLPLLLAMAAVGILYGLNRAGVARLVPYLLVGFVLCLCLFHAGIHTTIGGVVTGLAIPMRTRRDPSHSPVERCLHFLHPWVAFGILPLFAFTAAGVSLAAFSLASLGEPLALGIILGLFAGKQLGIFGATWLAVRAGIAHLPEGTGWRHIHAVALLAGIGFTMSLFIGRLAFAEDILLEQVKLGVLAGSLLSAATGAAMLRRALRRG